MGKQFIQPKGLYTHPYFTHVAKVSSGSYLFVAGQAARDVNGNIVGKGNLEIQVRKAYENLRIALEAGGATLKDVVKTTIYVKSTLDFKKVYPIRAEFFTETPPPNTLIEVKQLADPDLLFEIEAIAIVDR